MDDYRAWTVEVCDACGRIHPGVCVTGEDFEYQPTYGKKRDVEVVPAEQLRGAVDEAVALREAIADAMQALEPGTGPYELLKVASTIPRAGGR